MEQVFEIGEGSPCPFVLTRFWGGVKLTIPRALAGRQTFYILRPEAEEIIQALQILLGR